MWPVSSLHSYFKLHFTHCQELICSAWHRVTHQCLELAAAVTYLPPVQVFPSQVTPDDLFTHSKGNASSLITGIVLAPSLANLSASSFFSIPWYLRSYSKVMLLGPLSFTSACLHFQTKANSVMVLASATVAGLLSEQMCTLLIITFLDIRNSVRLRIAITLAKNTVDSLLVGILPLWLFLRPQIPAPKQSILDPSVNQRFVLGSAVLTCNTLSSVVSIHALNDLLTDTF
jgi:hypothetical protein